MKRPPLPPPSPISPTNLVFDKATMEQMTRTTQDGMFFLDVAPGGSFRFAGMNPAMEKILGTTQMGSWGATLEEHLGGKGLDTLRQLCELSASTGETVNSSARIFGPPDRYYSLQLVPVRSAAGSIYRIAGIVRNTSPDDVHLEKTHRFYSILSEVTQLVIRSSDQAVLLAAVCRLSVERGGFRRVGIRTAGGEGLPTAWEFSGDELLTGEAALGSMPASLHDAVLASKAMAITTCPPAGAETDVCARLRSKGCGKIAILPLFVASELWGTIQFCSATTDDFDELERRMIAEIAEDIGYALESIRRQAERRHMEMDLLDRDQKTQSLLRLSQTLERLESRDAILEAAQADIERIIGYRNLWFYVFDDERRTARIAAACGEMGKILAARPEISTLTVNGRPMMEAIAAARDIVVIEDAATDPGTDKHVTEMVGIRTVVNVPVWLAGKTLGSVGTGTFGSEGIPPPSPTERDYLRSVAALMASALDRVHLLLKRQNAETALRESEERFATAFHRSPVAMAIIRADEGRFVDANELFSTITGYGRDEVVGNTLSGIRFLTSEKDREAVFSAARDRGTGHEFTIVNRSGSSRTVVISTAIIDLAGIKHLLLSLDDVTERALAENEAKKNEALRHHLELELIQSQKLESLGTLASGIAHDFNNVLGIILAHSSMAEQAVDGDHQATAHLATIRKASERGATLVNQLLTFARKADGIYQVLDLNDIVAETKQFLSGAFPKTIDFVTDLDPIAPHAVADASQMHQVLVNLCLNARDAMPQGGTVTVASSSKEFREVSPLFPKARAHRYLLLSIADTGLGMSEDIQKRMFDPFFTTKPPGKGSGLGLALVQSIVRSHHGFINVVSAPGRGTTVNVYLPADDTPQTAEPQAARTPIPMARGTETILVVEDEEMLADMAEAYLAGRGYTVIVAHDGQEAIEIYRQKRATINLVLSDIGLPLRSGEDVFRDIIGMNPSAKVILASGFIEPGSKSDLLLAGLRGFIQKPYALADVAIAVRRTLDAPIQGVRSDS